MEFLANENIPLGSVELLRELGHTVLAIQQEHPGMNDRQVLTMAHSRNMIVLTFDRDYGELIYAKKHPNPPGIIYFRFTPLHPREPAELLQQYLQIKEVVWEDHFTVIDRSKLRQKALP